MRLFQSKKMIPGLAVFVILLSGCSEKNQVPAPDIIATVEDKSITIQEFRKFYELDPNFGVMDTGVSELLNALERCIDQKLALQLAKQQKVFEDRELIVLVDWEKRQAILRQLFREEIQSRANVTETEIREAFLSENQRIFLRHLFFDNRELAEGAYRKLLSDPLLFTSLAKQVFRDSLLAERGGALGWVGWGDIHRELETVAFLLQPGEISQPVRSPWGYHILRVDSIAGDALLTDARYQSRKEIIKKRLLREKQLQLSNQYLSEKMRALDVKMKRPVFNFLWQQVSGNNENRPDFQLQPPFLDNFFLRRLEEQTRLNKNEILIEYKGGSISLGEFLASLKNIPVGNRPRILNKDIFTNDIGIWVRDEFLYREAQKKYIAGHPRIQEEVDEFLEDQAYQYYLSRVLDTLSVPAEVAQYYAGQTEEIISEYPEIRYIHTLPEWKYYRARLWLRNYLRESSPRIWVNIDLLRQEAGLVNWKNPVRMFLARPPA